MRWIEGVSLTIVSDWLRMCAYNYADGNMDAMRKRVITIALTSTLIPLFLLFLLGGFLHRRSTRIQRQQLSEVKHSEL